MKLTKKDIEAAELVPEVKADILSLFDSVEAKESELTKLRAKVPTDSQRVVDSVDHDKFIAATKELEKLKQEMAAKLQMQPAESAGLAAFAAFFS